MIQRMFRESVKYALSIATRCSPRRATEQFAPDILRLVVREELRRTQTFDDSHAKIIKTSSTSCRKRSG